MHVVTIADWRAEHNSDLSGAVVFVDEYTGARYRVPGALVKRLEEMSDEEIVG
jgi:hypothetical protein